MDTALKAEFNGSAFDESVRSVVAANPGISSICAVVFAPTPTADGVVHVYGGDKAVATNTLFRIASMTKSFTAAACLRLRDEVPAWTDLDA